MKTKQFNLAEAKAKLSHLVDRAARGEFFVIAKAGLPVAKLGPFQAAPKKIKFGVLTGRLSKRTLAELEAPLDQETINLMNDSALIG